MADEKKDTRPAGASRSSGAAAARPAEKKPAEKKPAEKKPAEKKPAEKKPAEKKPAEKKPAEKKPEGASAVETATAAPAQPPLNQPGAPAATEAAPVAGRVSMPPRLQPFQPARKPAAPVQKPQPETAAEPSAQPAPGRPKVFELAKELNISSEALINVLTEMGIRVRSHMSILSDAQVTGVKARFEREKQEARDRGAKSRKKRKRRRKLQVSAEAVRAVRDTVAQMEASAVRTQKKRRRRYREEKQERHERLLAAEGESSVLKVTEFTSPSELAELMGVSLNEVIAKCLELGVMATANQRLDADTIALLAGEFGRNVEAVAEYGAEALEQRRLEKSDREVPRPPVVTIMGHVDHGKTALLDRIRSTNVISTEFGGITQHIGAYTAILPDGRRVTFIDTPGHAAFTAMRTRGAQVTDIVVLVVATDSRVMPQTEEAIDHARAAGVPIIVAISKMDLSTANPDNVKQDLAAHRVLVEDWGGDVLCAQVSSITGEGVDDLLEKIMLQAEMLDLKAFPDRPARGAVLEGRIDPHRGSVVSVLVQDGTLHEGDCFVAGTCSGRIRALYDENGKNLLEAGPGTPVQVLGCSSVPEAGDSFTVVDTEQEAKDICLRRQLVERERELQSRRRVTLEDFYKSTSGTGGVLRLIVKADVQGSAEAIVDTLTRMGTDEVSVDIIRSGAGGISESDVMLAAASDAVIIGFRVRPDARAREKAASTGIDIETFNIIYDVEDTVKRALSGLLKPERREEFLGSAEVRALFRVPKVGTIAGCYVVGGLIRRSSRFRLVRNGVVTWEGELSSLKHFKEDRKEVAAGYECGIGLAGYGDVKVGDIIECYEIVEVSRAL
ncbi:translation initiation factor IF-2 [Candidatus Fermentibacteria bacterium]|nr:translation initiation factor IF-2 [Candidatus Fermentibacteria bacterium]